MSNDERRPVGSPSRQRGTAVSVIVYTFDDVDAIEWCLSSLTNQTFTRGFEVIIVDDCSSDDTAQIIADRFLSSSS